MEIKSNLEIEIHRKISIVVFPIRLSREQRRKKKTSNSYLFSRAQYKVKTYFPKVFFFLSLFTLCLTIWMEWCYFGLTGDFQGEQLWGQFYLWIFMYLRSKSSKFPWSFKVNSWVKLSGTSIDWNWMHFVLFFSNISKALKY